MRFLQALYLNDNQLATVPPEIGELENLRSLDLSNNMISYLPPEIGDLVKLEWVKVYLIGLYFTTLHGLCCL